MCLHEIGEQKFAAAGPRWQAQGLQMTCIACACISCILRARRHPPWLSIKPLGSLRSTRAGLQRNIVCRPHQDEAGHPAPGLACRGLLGCVAVPRMVHRRVVHLVGRCSRRGCRSSRSAVCCRRRPLLLRPRWLGCRRWLRRLHGRGCRGCIATHLRLQLTPQRRFLMGWQG